jgi:hypothetical protein
MQHTTTSSETVCRNCRRPLLHAWDEGLLVKADAAPLNEVVADALRDAGARVYARTRAGHLIYESADRIGVLRLVVSRHAEHACRGETALPVRRHRQLELFDHESVHPPARRNGGLL